jgi:RNA polymerase sigma-70 factor (ECF subfamily)
MDAEEQDDTQQLVARSLAGDESAYAELFTRHEPELRRVIAARISPLLQRRFDVSDVLQETRVVLLERLKEFAAARPEEFRQWLRNLALQRLADLRRRHAGAQKRSVLAEQLQALESSEEFAAHLARPGLTPSAEVSANETKRRLHRALAELRESDREILNLRYIEQLSNRKVAARLQISEPAASKRHAMALLRLQRTLRKLFPGEEVD